MRAWIDSPNIMKKHRTAAITTVSHAPLLGELAPERFIKQYWQQRALLLQQVITASEARQLITRDQLLKLACDDDVESRLVQCDTGERNWHSNHGPFRKTDFARLPQSHWTLLVQAVDQWLPAVAALLPRFAFLPRWRLDDIMISCATRGGGVGPHFDYYDVFLLQAAGTREWKLGQHCDETSELRDNPDMKLLKQFRQSKRMILTAGDMLYIPAGLAHWGTALDDDCITISIGFRAASQRELVQIALNSIAASLPDHQRYRDTRAAIDADHSHINKSAIDEAMRFWKQLDAKVVREAIARALGEYATQPRNPDRIAPETLPSEKQFNTLLRKAGKQGLRVIKHPASRLAWRAINKQQAQLFVDGESYVCTKPFAQQVCSGKITTPALKAAADKILLFALVEQGSVTLAAARK